MTPLPVLLTGPGPLRTPARLAHQESPPTKQTLSAPVPRTALRSPCMPGVQAGVPPVLPPVTQQAWETPLGSL